MNGEKFNYTVDFLSGAMSLRKPQAESLEILDKILDAIELRKNINLSEALAKVHAIRNTCTDFEREFVSLTFALATGVGKTRLMGAFIAYLYARHNIKNFFVVAPNTTIYEKIKNDLENTSSPKYIFQGTGGLFNMTPKIFADDDYRNRQISIEDEAGIKIYLYNIDKFNKEGAKMKKINEILGESFYNFLSNLPDLVLIMDESHHYRAERGAAALNELNPVLGLELTATPVVNKGSKQEKFQNTVYEYPLKNAIEDGYTRTPYAMTRTDINFQNFGEELLDETMLNDGIKYHEKVKLRLRVFADSNKKRLVKPFMLVVCKDTEHAAKVEEFIKSPRFKNGEYANKVIKIDSKQKKSESDENIKLLQGVEDSNNPVEIVIHVNMLKEGWDVNNLYTIVPLRTAASKILREQMVGRGLRLPYGIRTGDKEIDSVMLTAHDKFSEIIEEAAKGDSIFKRGNIIKAEDLEDEHTASAQININFDKPEFYTQNEKLNEIFTAAEKFIKEEISTALKNSQGKDEKESEITPAKKKEIVKKVSEKISEDINKNKNLSEEFLKHKESVEKYTEKTIEAAAKKFIPIPQVKIIHAGRDELIFADFDLDTSKFNLTPPDDALKVKNLIDFSDSSKLEVSAIDLSKYDPVKDIIEELKLRPEIDYDKNSALIFKLIMQAAGHFSNKFGADGMKKIFLNDRLEIINKIYDQMLLHVRREEGYTFEEVTGVKKFNMPPSFNYNQTCGLYENFTGNIKSVLFTGIKKGVFDSAKFDSKDGELKLARLMEEDNSVESWLRPDAKEFNLRYMLNEEEHNYIPDFVADTEKFTYMIEIKGQNLLDDSDTAAKKNAGKKYCELASAWAASNGSKEWRYLFIPADGFNASSTFGQIAQKFSC